MQTAISGNLEQVRQTILSTPQLQPNGGRGIVNGPASLSVASQSNILVPQKTTQLPSVAQILSVNQYPLPDAFTVQVASAAGGGAVATRVFLLQQATLNDITNNGSGAASITYTYQDGFAGRNVSNIVGNARNGMGAICFGFSIRMNVTAGGAGDAAGLAAVNASFRTFDAYGTFIPLNVSATENQERGDFDTSIMVWRCAQNLSLFTQLSFVMPVADTATVTIYTTPDFKL